MKSLSRDVANMALHDEIHESINRTRRELYKMRVNEAAIKEVLNLVNDINGDDDLAITSDVAQRVNNMQKVQAEDRLEFFNRLHDELFPDGLQMHNE